MPLSQLLKQSSGELQAELQIILNAIVEGLCGVDAQANVTFCNEALLAMTGYRSEEVIGRSFHDAIHDRRPDGAPYPDKECPLRSAIDARRESHVAGEILWRKDGTRFPVELWAHPLHQPSSPTVSVITIQDITERERAIESLKISEEKFRRILSSVAEVAWTSDRDGRTIYISPRVEDVLGYTKQEISAAGSTLRLGLIHPGDFGRVKNSYLALFEKERVFDEEYRIRRKDGSWIWIHDHATGTHEENGILYADGAFSDVSERKKGEAELRWKTAFLEAQTNSTLDGMALVDPDGRTVYANYKFIQIFPKTPEIIVERREHAMLQYVLTIARDPERFQSMASYFNQYPAEIGRNEFELTNGTILDVYSSPVIDHEGKHYGRIWTIRDITEQKRDEDILRQLSTAVEQSPASVIITDPSGDISYVNRKFTEVTGYQPEEVLGKNPRILRSGLTLPETYADFWSTIRQGREWRGEFCNKKKNGELFWEAATIRPITDAKGAITHYLALKEDITERKRAEEALRASEKRYRQLFERTLAGVFRTTLDGRILECNPAAARMFGCDSPEELLSLPITKFYPTPSDREALLTRLKAEKSVTNHEIKFQRKDGESAWAILNLSLVDDDSAGWMTEGTFLDITERKRVEEELYASRQMLQSILDAIPQRVFWKARNVTYLGCNRAFALDAGVESPAAIVGKSDFDLAWRASAESYRADDQRVMEQGLSKLNFEERQIRPDGGVLWLQTNKLPLHDREGNVTGVVGTYEDITARKEADQTLQRSEEKFRALAENIHEVFWMMSPNADEVLYVSPAYELVWGRKREILYQNPMAWVEAIHPEDLARAHAIFARQMQGERIESEYRIRTLEGDEKWISDRAFPVRDKDGQIIRVVGIAEEITNRKRAEEELRLAQSSLENASDGVFWMNPQAAIVYANQAACRSLGYSREELVSLSIPDIDPNFPQKVWPAFWAEIKTRGSKTFETLHKTKQGRTFSVEVTANFLEFSGQEYAFAFARDITERRELEGQLRQAQKLEGIGQLAAGIAHEINTPTQFVTDNLTFLRDSWKATHDLLQTYRAAIRNAAAALPPGAVAELEKAEQACDLDFVVAEVPHAIDQSLEGAHRVAEIVRAMKEFSHPDAAEKTATDLNKAVTSTVTVARNEWKYVADVSTRLDETLPPVVCYPGDVNQVILNLVVNAAHAIKEKAKDGEKGKITVCTRMRGEFAEISVTDSGTGIPEAIRSRIFDPFFTTKEVGKGTGQGLSLAHAVVVKKHSGKIWFETEMGQGTTFFINLPVKPPDCAKEN